MNWHYEKDGSPVGPVTETQLEAAKMQGQIHSSTRVRREDWAGWKKAGEVWPSMRGNSPSDTGASPQKARRCAECGATSPDLITLDGVFICPACRTGALDKIRQGVPLGIAGGSAGPWRDGDLLVVNKEGRLPERCIKCGAPPVKHLQRQLSWHHPAFFFLVIVSIPIYYLTDFIVRKKAMFLIPICGPCNARRVRNLIIGFTSFFLGLGLIGAAFWLVGTFPDATNALCLAGLALFLFSLFWATSVEFLIVKKMNKHFLWIEKAGKDLLAGLPPWPGE